MKRSSGPRRTADLSESMHRQLNMYAISATAAGVSLLALAQPSQAKIVYTPTHQVIGKDMGYQIDLNHDGITDFTIKNSHCSYNQSGRTSCQVDSWNLLSVTPVGNNAVEATGGPLRSALDLRRGARIPDHRKFIGRATLLSQCRGACNTSHSGTRIYGLWRNVANRYLGLKFTIKGKTHYGWARLSVDVSEKLYRITAVLTGYAYETIANKAIIAGQTKGPDGDSSFEQPNPTTLTAPPPQPATFGLARSRRVSACGLAEERHRGRTNHRERAEHSMKRQPRTTSKLSQSIHYQLNAYTIAAAAAGVGVLALAQPAEAKIVYTRVHKQIPSDNLYFYLDLNHDGVNDFAFLNFQTSEFVSLGVLPANAGNEMWSHSGDAAALRGGVRIGPKGKFYQRSYESMAAVDFTNATCRGPWRNATSRYLGLKFIIKGKTHFGWARLNVGCNATEPQITAVLTGYAYETIPNKPIIAGQTKNVPYDPANGIEHAPQPPTVGLLALGSPGLSIWRRDAGFSPLSP